ncbi:MAG: hypothetical protein HY316_05550 [Acidobacteria bacterium]|nr:hypothetical protein [Acidobacteriota bacterium]
MRNPIWLCMATITLTSAVLMLGCQGGGTGSSESAQSQTTGPSKVNTAVSKDNPCTLLTPEQVVEAVGLTPFGREVVDEVTCSYEFPEPAEKEPAAAQDSGGSDDKSDEEEAEAMAKAFTVGAAGGVPKFSYTIHWEDGKTAVMATRMANQLMGSEMENAFTKLEGIGDETWLGPLASTLIILKGEVAVELDLRLLPEGKARGTRLAQAIASRL